MHTTRGVQTHDLSVGAVKTHRATSVIGSVELSGQKHVAYTPMLSVGLQFQYSSGLLGTIRPSLCNQLTNTASD
jgi:hypothetical protein